MPQNFSDNMAHTSLSHFENINEIFQLFLSSHFIDKLEKVTEIKYCFKTILNFRKILLKNIEFTVNIYINIQLSTI